MKPLMGVGIGLLAMALAIGTVEAKPPPPAWSRCAGNGGLCANNGPGMFRFGYDDNWAEIEGRGDVACIPDNFVGGMIFGDPFGPGIPEADKRCEKMKP